MDLSGATIMCQHKKSPQALRTRGTQNEPLLHYDLVACSLNSRLRFKGSEQNIFIKEDTTSKSEISGQLLLSQVAPLFGLIQKFGKLFDSEIRGVHTNLLFPIHHFVDCTPYTYTNLLIFTKNNLTIIRR